eukprot:scaffold385_cov305-Pinguiococcus_pyrenoidosus.AAC.11
MRLRRQDDRLRAPARHAATDRLSAATQQRASHADDLGLELANGWPDVRVQRVGQSVAAEGDVHHLGVVLLSVVHGAFMG